MDIVQAMAEIERLRAENERLRKVWLDEAEQRTLLKELIVNQAGVKAQYEGGVVQIIAESVMHQFTESGAKNYMEMTFSGESIDLVVTIQRRDGLTPHQLRAAAEAEIERVKAGWLRAIDEEMVATHLGVAEPGDSYEDAKRKLNLLIAWHVAVATDPALNQAGDRLVQPEH